MNKNNSTCNAVAFEREQVRDEVIIVDVSKSPLNPRVQEKWAIAQRNFENEDLERSIEEQLEAASQRRDKLIRRQQKRLSERLDDARRTVEQQKAAEEERSRQLRASIDDQLKSATERRRKLQQANVHRVSRHLHRVVDVVAEKRKRMASLSPQKVKIDMSTASPPKKRSPCDDRQLMRATKGIQRWWRVVRPSSSIASLVTAWKRSDITLESASQLSFDDFVPRIMSTEAQATLSALLQRVQLLYRELSTSGSAIAPYRRVTPRMFLSAFVVVVHPSEVLGAVSHREQDLQNCARNMLEKFERLCDTVVSNTWAGLHQHIVGLMATQLQYAMAFRQWKCMDAAALAVDFIAAYMELEKMKAGLDRDFSRAGPQFDRAACCQDIQNKQNDLRANLQRIGGVDAIARLNAAINEFEAHRSQLLSGTPTPTPASPTTSTPPKTPASSPSPRTNGGGSSSGTNAANPDNRALEEGEEVAEGGSPRQRHRRRSPPAAEPEQQPAVSQMINQQLAHEVIIDPTFRLTTRPSRWGGVDGRHAPLQNLEHRVSSTMHAAFWDSLAASVTSEPPEYSQLLSVLQSIVDDLSSLTPRRSDLHRELAEHLDIPLLQQQIAHSALDVQDCIKLVGFLGSRLLALQSPARNESTRQWLSGAKEQLASSDHFAHVLPDVFRSILEQVEQVRVDMANFHLSMLAPYLQNNGIAYERQKLDAAIASKQLDLTQTRKALLSVLNSDAFSEEQRSLVKDSKSGVVERVVRQLLVDAVCGDTAPEVVPETFNLDISRILGMRRRLELFAFHAASMLLCSQVASAASLVLPPALADSLLSAIEDWDVSDHSTPLHAAVVAAASAALPDLPESKLDLLESLLSKTLVTSAFAPPASPASPASPTTTAAAGESFAESKRQAVARSIPAIFLEKFRCGVRAVVLAGQPWPAELFSRAGPAAASSAAAAHALGDRLCVLANHHTAVHAHVYRELLSE